MNLFPLCTAKVWPTKSGVIVQERDQVFITFFWFDLLSASTCSSTRWLTNGPFFSERVIALLSPPFHDVFARRLFSPPGLLSLRVPAPRRNRMRVPLRGFPLSAAVGMVDRVHHDPPRLRA